MTPQRRMSSIEKHQIKISLGVAVVVILFVIGMVVNFTSWKAQMEEQHRAFLKQQEDLIKDHETLFAEMKQLELDGDERDVQMATINAKLANIESLLLEMRTDLKTHND